MAAPLLPLTTRGYQQDRSYMYDENYLLGGMASLSPPSISLFGGVSISPSEERKGFAGKGRKLLSTFFFSKLPSKNARIL